MNFFQILFEQAGYDLNNDEQAAILCDAIKKYVEQRCDSQPTFFSIGGYSSCDDVVMDLKKRIISTGSKTVSEFKIDLRYAKELLHIKG